MSGPFALHVKENKAKAAGAPVSLQCVQKFDNSGTSLSPQTHSLWIRAMELHFAGLQWPVIFCPHTAFREKMLMLSGLLEAKGRSLNRITLQDWRIFEKHKGHSFVPQLYYAQSGDLLSCHACTSRTGERASEGRELEDEQGWQGASRTLDFPTPLPNPHQVEFMSCREEHSPPRGGHVTHIQGW